MTSETWCLLIRVNDMNTSMATPSEKETNIAYPVMTLESIDEYCNHILDKGVSDRTVGEYRRMLSRFYAFLPDSKKICENSAKNWESSLLKSGYSGYTVRTYLILINHYLSFHKLWEMRAENLHRPVVDEAKIPTREEYLHLLNTAILMGKEKIYYLVKTIVALGIKLKELPLLTVEALRVGYIQVGTGQGERIIPIPHSLQNELMGFARRQMISTGPLFLSRKGTALKPVSVVDSLRALAHVACMDRRKATIKGLLNMRERTLEDILTKINAQAEQKYDEMLERELMKAGADDRYWSMNMKG